MSAKRKPGGKLNALRGGIFAREVVIASAGESQEDFDRLYARWREDFPPQNIAQEALLSEVVITWWQIQRVRRFEAAQIITQIETARRRSGLEEEAEMETLKNEFFIARYRLHLEPNLPEVERRVLEHSLAETRRGLEGTPRGVEFLIEQLQTLQSDLKIHGYLQPHMETLLQQLCGLEAHRLHGFHHLNQLAKKERQKVQAGGNEQVEQNGGTTGDKNANPSPAPEHVPEYIKMIRQLRPDKNANHISSAQEIHLMDLFQREKEAEAKVLPREDGRVECERQDNAAAEAHSLEFFSEFDESFRGALEDLQKHVKQMWVREMRERGAQNTADKGADANVGGERFDAIRAFYQSLSQEMEEIYLRDGKRAERNENAAAETADISQADEFALVLSAMIHLQIKRLKQRKMQLELLRAAEEKAEPASLVILPAELQDKIHRAEAALERRYYKAHDRLLEMVGPKKSGS